MFHAEDERLCEVEDKLQLSEEQQMMDEIHDIVEMDSYLRDHGTNNYVESRGSRSNSDFEHVPVAISLEEYSNESSNEDVFDETNNQDQSQSYLKISREGLRKQKKTSACN